MSYYIPWSCILHYWRQVFSTSLHLKNFLVTLSLTDHLSSLLKVKVVPANGVSAITQFKMKKLEEPEILLLNNLTHFREEVANSIEFSKLLSSGVSIFVNDAFSLSHRILASTVGVARFCHASVAGFHFEEEYFQLMKISESKKQPYLAIVVPSILVIFHSNFQSYFCMCLLFTMKSNHLDMYLVLRTSPRLKVSWWVCKSVIILIKKDYCNVVRQEKWTSDLQIRIMIFSGLQGLTCSFLY